VEYVDGWDAARPQVGGDPAGYPHFYRWDVSLTQRPCPADRLVPDRRTPETLWRAEAIPYSRPACSPERVRDRRVCGERKCWVPPSAKVCLYLAALFTISIINNKSACCCDGVPVDLDRLIGWALGVRSLWLAIDEVGHVRHGEGDHAVIRHVDYPFAD